MTQVFVEGKICFTVLTDCLLRIEQADQGEFVDLPSATVVNRSFPDVAVTELRQQNGHVLELITEGFHLYYEGGELSATSLYIDFLQTSALYHSRWYFGQENGGNLKGTIRTLDNVNGSVPLADGIQSRDGYSCLDDSESFLYLADEDRFIPRPEGGIDCYLFCYGHRYQEALTDYYQLTGFPPLLPRYALGNWWSRFYPYTQESYQDLMQTFEDRQVPIHVSVLDIDWHKRDIPQRFGSGWTGYSWDRGLFPHPEALLAWLHEKGKKVTLNVHPAAGIRAFEDQYPAVAEVLGLDTENEEPASFDLENQAFRKAYFDLVHHPLEAEGVDFWWIDWQQGTARSKEQMDPLWLLNHYHYEDSVEQQGEGLTLSRYDGPGSHRYPVGFSGDTVISWESLDFQPYFTSTAANIGYTWWSHDIGGHMLGSFDGELSTRWIQFGVFSPINRLHSSNNRYSGKEPWNFRMDEAKAQEDFLRLRGHLLPYLESANVRTHLEGVPISQPMYYAYPERYEAYEAPNQYLFGSEMIVSAITRPHDEETQTAYAWTWLPEGQWVDYFSHLPYHGNTRLKTYRSLDQLPVFVKQGSIIVTDPDAMSKASELPNLLKIQVFPGADATYRLYEHRGNQIASTLFSWNEASQSLTWQVEDPDGILPPDRCYQTDIVVYQEKALLDELDRRLRQAHTDYGLKQYLYDRFTDPDYQYGAFVNTLSRIENSDLRDSLLELAYIRSSYASN